MVLDGVGVRDSISMRERGSVMMLDGASVASMRERTSVLVEEGWPIWAVRGWGGGGHGDPAGVAVI